MDSIRSLSLLFFLLLSYPGTALSAGLRADGTRFVDETGATVLLRGWNMSAKVPPYDHHATEASFRLLRSWGANVIRLSFIWEAMEPVRGEYNEAYLASMDQLVQWASQYGIWVIIDIHQDSYSRYSLEGCGEGFPEWAVHGEKAEPDNSEACEGWGRLMYEDYAENGPMQQEWQAFYGNENGVRDAYFLMIEMLAKRYRSQANVIGIDLMNEPFGEYAQIYSLYAEASGYVRGMAPDWLLFLSPHAMTSGSLHSVGFGEKPDIPQIAISPHYYDPVMMSFGRYQAAGRYLGESEGMGATLAGWTYADLRTALTELSGLSVPGGINVRSPGEAVADLQAIAEEWNVPVFVGEFGSPEDAVDLEFFLDEFYAAMDEHQVSGAQWLFAPQWTAEAKDGWNHEDLSSVDHEGKARRTWRSRPYPQRVSGHIQSLEASFERPGEGRSIGLALSWLHQSDLGNTEIYLPRLIDDVTLAEQYEIVATGAVWQIDEARQILELSGDMDGSMAVHVAYKKDLDRNRCRMYFQHHGFSCADGVAITFSGTNALGQQRSFVRYPDYPADQTYDFGEWQMSETLTITAARNSSTSVSHTVQMTPELCGSTATIEGQASCFEADWSLVLQE